MRQRERVCVCEKRESGREKVCEREIMREREREGGGGAVCHMWITAHHTHTHIHTHIYTHTS